MRIEKSGTAAFRTVNFASPPLILSNVVSKKIIICWYCIRIDLESMSPSCLTNLFLFPGLNTINEGYLSMEKYSNLVIMIIIIDESGTIWAPIGNWATWTWIGSRVQFSYHIDCEVASSCPSIAFLVCQCRWVWRREFRQIWGRYHLRFFRSFQGKFLSAIAWWLDYLSYFHRQAHRSHWRYSQTQTFF